MSQREDLKKRMEKRNHDKNKRKPKDKKDKALVRKIGNFEVDFDTSLGKGQFGNVYRANRVDKPQQILACKHISEKRLSSDDAYDQNTIGKTLKDRLLDEIKTHQSLGQCEHIVQLIEIEIQKDGYFLFMEMCETDLGKRIKSVGSFQQQQAMIFFNQLLKGYKHLFDRKISHRDLKPENLLLQGNELKIADFGFVKVSEDIDLITRSQQKSQFMAESVVGSINYIAPDVLLAQSKGVKYNPFKSDVWSMGIILYKMIYGREPYRAASKSQLLEQIDKEKLSFPQEKKVSEKIINLLQSMIEKDPAKRIDFKSIYEEFVQEGAPVEEAKIMKEAELMFYNELMTKISYDSSNHATLREIGIEEYQQFSSQLMTLIHERREKVLEKNMNEDVDESVKNPISVYSNTFYYAIKESCEIEKSKDYKEPDNLLLKLLKILFQKLLAYEDFDLLHKNVQYFLILLVQLYCFEGKKMTIDLIRTMMEKQRNNKMTLASLDKIKKNYLNEMMK